MQIGDTAPDFTLPAVTGDEVSLAGSDSLATLVYWTCNHCPYALAWHERLLDFARDYEAKGVRVIAVNSNSAVTHPTDSFEAMADRVAADGGWPHPFCHDGSQSVAREWRAAKTPELFLLDADLVLRYRGAPDADYDDAHLRAEWLRGATDAVLSNGDPEPVETPAVGCSIKWAP